MPCQHGLRRRVGFLPVHAPVFQIVQRNVLTGNCTAYIRARRRDTKVAVEVFDLRFTVAGWSEFIEQETIP